MPADQFREAAIEAAHRIANEFISPCASNAEIIAAEFAPLAERLSSLESENQRLRELLRDALSHIRDEYEDERETRAKIRAAINQQEPKP